MSIFTRTKLQKKAILFKMTKLSILPVMSFNFQNTFIKYTERIGLQYKIAGSS